MGDPTAQLSDEDTIGERSVQQALTLNKSTSGPSNTAKFHTGRGAFGGAGLLIKCEPHDDLPQIKSDGSIVGALLAGKEFEAVQLIETGTSVNQSIEDSTPLHEATGYINGTITKLLISHKAKVNAENRYGKTALHLAARLGHMEVIEILLAHGAKVNAKNNGRSGKNMPEADFNTS
jgi:ankyrin repeat protein